MPRAGIRGRRPALPAGGEHRASQPLWPRGGLLDRLGGGAWQAKKARLKERIRQIADKLIRVAAERELRSAPILEPPGDMWEAFNARFPYEETDDQLSAIADVLEDLERGRPMDRLVVGDVGFGKTEVAMRAAFVAAARGCRWP
jgi:transcription-repair coupling factor (superfamily II helicase)